MNKLAPLDSEYIIKGENNEKSLIIGVKSTSLNASAWLRINDEYLANATCKSLLTELKVLEDNMVYQSEKGILF